MMGGYAPAFRDVAQQPWRDDDESLSGCLAAPFAAVGHWSRETVRVVRKRRSERQAETPGHDAWDDPMGIGRCRRCALYLVHDETVSWTVKRRFGGADGVQFGLCLQCSDLVLSAWHLGGRV
jgi:hypothetical protein